MQLDKLVELLREYDGPFDMENQYICALGLAMRNGDRFGFRKYASKEDYVMFAFEFLPYLFNWIKAKEKSDCLTQWMFDAGWKQIDNSKEGAIKRIQYIIDNGEDKVYEEICKHEKMKDLYFTLE